MAQVGGHCQNCINLPILHSHQNQGLFLSIPSHSAKRFYPRGTSRGSRDRIPNTRFPVAPSAARSDGDQQRNGFTRRQTKRGRKSPLLLRTTFSRRLLLLCRVTSLPRPRRRACCYRRCWRRNQGDQLTDGRTDGSWARAPVSAPNAVAGGGGGGRGDCGLGVTLSCAKGLITSREKDGRTDEMGDARTDARRRRAETAVECNTLFRKAALGARTRTEGRTDERRENRLVADRITGKEGTDDRREPRDSHCTCGRTISMLCATFSHCRKAGLSHLPEFGIAESLAE